MKPVEPQVTIIASTTFHADAAAAVMGRFRSDIDGGQALAEGAGRACYESWNKPNPATATNAGYLRHILEVGHESVLEHATVSFYVTGVSRSLLCELTRHRHLSFSVRSQRYVDEGDPAIVVPPALASTASGVALLDGTADSTRLAYATIAGLLSSAGWTRKQAREAARAVLPNMIETRFVVSGNLRAWRDVLRRRWHVAADAEIRRFAGLILDELREVAPNAFQDFPSEPFGTEGGAV